MNEWYLVAGNTRLFKKIHGPSFGSDGPKSGPKWDFPSLYHKFFFEIAYSGSLQQCLTPSRGKIHEKKLGAQIWGKRVKIVPEIGFFSILSSFDSLVFLEIAYNDCLQQFLTSSSGNTHDKSFRCPNLGQNWAWNLFFYHFLKFIKKYIGWELGTMSN